MTDAEITLEPEGLTRPIIGIENRTPQEVFDIMADRFRAARRTSPGGSGEVGVLPLEWWKNYPSEFMSRADTIVGSYRVWSHHEASGEWFWQLSEQVSQTVASEAEAKAACQSDFASRIRSALSPSSSAVPTGEVTDAQVDAALAFWCAKLPKDQREQPIPEKLREHMRGTLEAAAPQPPASAVREGELERLARQTIADLKAAHEEICKLQGLDPASHSWPIWSSPAHTIAWGERILRALSTQEQVIAPATGREYHGDIDGDGEL